MGFRGVTFVEYKSLLFVLSVIFLISTVDATYISIASSIGVETIVNETQSRVQILVENRGDEAAHNVQVSLIPPKGMSASEPQVVGILNPMQRYTGIFEITPSADMLPGRYPLILVIEYADANGYPFSAFAKTVFTYQKPAPSHISGAIEPLEISEKGGGSTKLTLTNRDDQLQTVTVQLHVSKELVATPEIQEVTIEPKSQKEIKYEIRSIGALPGSTYPYIAAITNEDEGLAHATIVMGQVKIVAESSSSYLKIAIALLIAIFIIMQLKRLKLSIRVSR
ncbi:MAG: NEW3 domain-containing protein [Candidatus Altiarchaeota archaeon]